MKNIKSTINLMTFSGEKLTEVNLESAMLDLGRRGVCTDQSYGGYRLLIPTETALTMALDPNVSFGELIALCYLLAQQVYSGGVDSRTARAIDQLVFSCFMKIQNLTGSATSSNYSPLRNN